MPTDCPDCVIAIEELVQEIRKMTTKNILEANVATKMERELQTAIAESKKDTPELKSILGKLDAAKALVEGDSSARGLLPKFAETTSTIKRHLP